MTSRSVIGEGQPHQEPLLVLVELDLIDAATQRADDRCLLFGLQLDRSRAAVVAPTNQLQPLPKTLLVVVPTSPPLHRPKRVTGDLDLIVAQDHVWTGGCQRPCCLSFSRASDSTPPSPSPRAGGLLKRT